MKHIIFISTKRNVAGQVIREKKMDKNDTVKLGGEPIDAGCSLEAQPSCTCT